MYKRQGYTLEDIQSFEDLKKVAEDITSRKDELGFAAFTSAGMDGKMCIRDSRHALYGFVLADDPLVQDAVQMQQLFALPFHCLLYTSRCV